MTVGMLITCSNIWWVESRWAAVSAGGAASADVAVSNETAAINRCIGTLQIVGGTLRFRNEPSSGGAVALSKIFGAAHFLEPAGSAREFEAAVALRVQGRRLRVGCGEQLDPVLVQRVDQGHE